MIRQNQKQLNRLQVLLDAAAILLALILAYYLRFYTSLLPAGVISVPLRQAVEPFIAIVPIYLAIYNLMELYNTRRTRMLYDEIRRIVSANTIGVLVLVLLLFIFRLINFSRYVLLLFYFLNIAITSAMRGAIRLLLRHYRRKGFNLKHCLLIGATSLSADFLRRVREHPEWGYHMVGILDQHMKTGSIFAGQPILNDLDHLETLLATQHLDIVIIATDTQDDAYLGKLISACEKAGVKTNIIPYYYKYVPAKPYVDELDGMPIIDTRHVPLDNVIHHLLKRACDIALSLLALTLTAPLMILCAVMIKITSPGPVIFHQERVGLNRENFIMYKFRSMHLQQDEEADTRWTTADDPRKTRWGAFMRKSSLDELPQFFNVLKGDMSIVGPRPERPHFVEQFKEKIPKYMIKHQVRPGITGWAQVNGWRGDTSIAKRIEYDLYYIENWTLSMDLKILLLTIFKGLVNRNAY